MELAGIAPGLISAATKTKSAVMLVLSVRPDELKVQYRATSLFASMPVEAMGVVTCGCAAWVGPPDGLPAVLVTPADTLTGVKLAASPTGKSLPAKKLRFAPAL